MSDATTRLLQQQAWPRKFQTYAWKIALCLWLFQEKDDPQLFRGAPPSKQTVEDFQAALATRLGELPPGSTGLFHLVMVYHSGQNGATYLRANNAAPHFSPSEASTHYVNQNRSYYTSPSRIERQIKVVKAPARSPARQARALPKR